MLSLLFRIEPDHYALDSREIVEVRPLCRLKQLPGAPAWVAGLFEHAGAPVPVIDLCALALGRPAPDRRCAGLVLVRDGAPG
ncbi:chemotaxis protein CheW, partial [Crenobacter sp. SG2305]|uniref:chemotaxis protein CheW n=1 Tax=Crenobacter oryzisoli TaxID=3056844 RepID=UPI0025AAAAC7